MAPSTIPTLSTDDDPSQGHPRPSVYYSQDKTATLDTSPAPPPTQDGASPKVVLTINGCLGTSSHLGPLRRERTASEVEAYVNPPLPTMEEVERYFGSLALPPQPPAPAQPTQPTPPTQDGDGDDSIETPDFRAELAAIPDPYTPLIRSGQLQSEYRGKKLALWVYFNRDRYDRRDENVEKNAGDEKECPLAGERTQEREETEEEKKKKTIEQRAFEAAFKRALDELTSQERETLGLPSLGLDGLEDYNAVTRLSMAVSGRRIH